MAMRKGAAVLGFVVLLSPSALRAQGVAIDHVKVGCIVAGKYPNLKACFAPVSSLARARVYFRVADAPPDWYYVEMASSDPCHAGVLPRPKKELVGRRIQYYVDAFDRAFAESRTPEAEAVVVASASECERRLPVAPFLDRARVAVFPSLPAGFAGAGGGLGGAATAAIAVGGAAIVGGGVALATGGSEGSTGSSPTTTAPPPETLPTTTTTTTTTTLPEVPFNPVFKVLKGATLVEGDTVVGTDPLQLRFDMCETTGPLRLRFGVEVDDVQKTDRCNSTITFRMSDATPPFVGSTVRQSLATRTYAVRMTIRSEGPNNDPKANRRLTVRVESAVEGGCTGDTTGPIVTLTKPPTGSVYPSPNAYPVHFEASASDSTTGNNGVARVEYKIGSPEPMTLTPGTTASPWPLDWTETEVNTYLGLACAKTLEVRAYAEDSCGNGTYSSPITITVNNTGPCATPDAGPAPGASSSAILVSELGVPGGAGQIVANGEAVFPRTGRSPFAVRLKAGENRVEATLVEARAGGTWRFELGALPGFQPETLRAVAGDVVQVAADSVTFRLQGRPGERIVFTFRTER
jgi:hypothetical protein